MCVRACVCAQASRFHSHAHGTRAFTARLAPAHSYITRTATWEQFPHGQWDADHVDRRFDVFRGDDVALYAGCVRARAQRLGEWSKLPMMMALPLASVYGGSEERRAVWGEAIVTEEDVHSVFAAYVVGRVP